MQFLKMNIVIVATVLAGLFANAAVANNNPYLKPDDTWISISGEVKSVQPDSFELDYGDGIVIVEMDDGDRDADAYKLLQGDKVTVNGMIDDDFYEMTSIEASSVYVEKLDSYFYASPVDEEDYAVWYTVPVVIGQVTVQGLVTEVDDDEFTLNTGLRSVTIDTDDMAYDPLDNEGYQKIEKGDFVRVNGKLEEKLFSDKKELVANSIVTLIN